MNNLTTTLCIVAAAASAILPVSGATTGAENLVPRSEFNKYRLVYDLNIQKEMPHLGWCVQAVPYDIDRSRQVAKGGFSRVAYFVETVSTNGGPFGHRFGPHQGHLRRHRHRLPLTQRPRKKAIRVAFRLAAKGLNVI